MIPSWVLDPGEIPSGRLRETKNLPEVVVKATIKKKTNYLLIAGIAALAFLILNRKK